MTQDCRQDSESMNALPRRSQIESPVPGRATNPVGRPVNRAHDFGTSRVSCDSLFALLFDSRTLH